MFIHISSYATAVIRHPCSLVAWSDIFLAGISILGHFLAQPGSPGFPGFSFSLSLSLSLFLSFFLVRHGLGGGISLSPVNPLDYAKKMVSLRWKFLQKT